MNNWEDLMNGWIKDTDVSPRQAKRAIQTFLTYLGNDVGVLAIKRETHINDVKGHSYTFRKYLIENLKSGSSKNVILSHLEKFFDYVVLQCNAVGKDYSNPISYKFDKFKIFKKSGTIRQALPLNIIEEMKRTLLVNNFQFSKEHFKQDWIKEILNETTVDMDREVFSYSTSIALYLLLTIPLRGIQVQLLDDGSKDEFIYDFNLNKMVKNPNGEKGRKEGFIRKKSYSGIRLEERESLWISTNKGSCGYELPYINQEILGLIRLQREFLGKYSPNPIKVDKSSLGKEIKGNSPKFYCLLRDLTKVGDRPVSKNKINRLWRLLCIEVQENTGFRLIKDGKYLYSIHSLRVSGITNFLELGISLETVSKYLVGHADPEITQYYDRKRGVKELLNESQHSLGVVFNFDVKQIEEKKE